MKSVRSILKNKSVIISLVLFLFLVPCVVHAADLDGSSSSVALPYLAPNLDDAKIYSIASDIKSTTATTYDIDDIYNMLISIRSYINTSNTTTSTILSRLEDLTGYNTAYDTHTMLVDLWSKLGGNENISLYQYVHDINECLEITDGNESYNVTELVAGIYGINGTPRSLSDIYDKLGTIDTSINDNFIAIANDTFSINSAIQRLADIYASNDVAQAKLNQQDYEDGAIADFTGSGTGAATTANKNDIKSISSTIKSGLNTGGSASNALGVFNYNNSNWSWFTQTTYDNLDTTPQPFNPIIYQGTFTTVAGNNDIPIDTIPSMTRFYVDITITPNKNTQTIVQFRYDTVKGQIIVPANSSHYNNWLEIGADVNLIRFYSMPANYTIQLKVYYPESENTRKSNNNYIPNFINKHDEDYYNSLLKEHK